MLLWKCRISEAFILVSVRILSFRIRLFDKVSTLSSRALCLSSSYLASSAFLRASAFASLLIGGTAFEPPLLRLVLLAARVSSGYSRD